MKKNKKSSGGSIFSQLEANFIIPLNERSQGFLKRAIFLNYEPCGINQASPPR